MDVNQPTEISHLVYMARLGFDIVPIAVTLHGKTGMLHLNGEGARFEPSDGTVSTRITWEEFDKLAKESK